MSESSVPTRKPPGPTRVRRSALAAVAIVVGLAVSGCAMSRRDGDAVAREAAASEAEQLGDDLGYRNRIRDAEYIAATEIAEEVPAGTIVTRRQPLSWSGRTSGSEQATIDVRIVVEVAESGSVYSDRGNSAGQATRCYRYLLRLNAYATYDEIDCPAVADPPVPSAAPVPRLPEDGRKRLTAALRGATPDTLAERVRKAFPAEHITVDTVVHQGALVAAVGVPVERECLLMVRKPDGDIVSPGYDRIWLEPGETGCGTGLYVSPPR
ncbi:MULTISPECIES: hypothetical protein [Micromonospora]|nr:hypothetical protein [Micromonospora yangpuensis]GGL88090.1 hypothetical protein GCM10012279_02220 [Micromonospora yangpuensis]